MKFNALKLVFLISTVLSLLVSGCKKENNMEPADMMWVGNSPIAGNQKSLYLVTLENNFKNKNGTYTWIWSVSNTNPGSGAPGSGTAQDLQSWGLTLGSCADLGQIISGSTSPDGLTWKNFNPEMKEVSASVAKPVIMFEQGTVNKQKSYYKLVVSQNFSTNKTVTAFYKSGAVTGSGVLTIAGFGCPMP
jgi:hypothetical protein